MHFLEILERGTATKSDSLEGALTRVRWNPVALVIGSMTMGGYSVSLGIFITIAKFDVVPVQRMLQFVFSQKWC